MFESICLTKAVSVFDYMFCWHPHVVQLCVILAYVLLISCMIKYLIGKRTRNRPE